MSEEEIKSLFRTVADHLESLAISIQNVEDLQAADHSRLDRLERLFKLMIRIGDRERKELRERINALIDAQMRSEVVFTRFQEQVTETQKATDARLTRIEEANVQFQAQVGVALSKLADATALSHQRIDALESQE
jgi:hypothetical protein